MKKFEPTDNTPGTLTVAQLIERLQKLPQDSIVELLVANPNDTAYSRAELEVKYVEGSHLVQIWASVFSDDPTAHAPWEDSEDD